MNSLRPALLLPPAALVLARSGVAQWPALLGMVLLGLRAMGLLRLPRRRWILALIAVPFVLQAALLPTESSFRNVVLLYGIGAHLFFWVAVHQALTEGSEWGAFPFAAGSIAAAALQLPPEQMWIPWLAVPLVPVALLPREQCPGFLPPRGSRLAWALLWLLSLAAFASVETLWARHHYRWTGWHGRGSSDVLLGFSAQTDLNRSPGPWRTHRQRQIVLRLYGENCSVHLAGRVYSVYKRGVWSSRGPARLVEPSGKLVDLDVYGSPREEADWIWVEPLIPLQGTLFAPFDPEAVAVSAVAETLAVSREGFPEFRGASSPAPWRFLARAPGEPYGTRPAELDLSEPPDSADLALPAELKPWLDSLGASIWSPEDGDSAAVAAMRAWFAGEFAYDWNNPAPVDGDPVRGFVAERRGYCEHFASLAVLLLRSRGIPARYVKGWLPGERMGGGCAVRRVQAHSWTAVWNGEAWAQQDFTPPGSLGETPVSKARLLRERLAAWLGSVKLVVFHGRWRLALEEGANRWQGLLVPAEILAFAAIALLLLRRRRRLAALSEAQRLWAKSARLLRAEGISAGKGETAGALLERLRATKRTRRVAEAIALLERYEEIRWKG